MKTRLTHQMKEKTGDGAEEEAGGEQVRDKAEGEAEDKVEGKDEAGGKGKTGAKDEAVEVHGWNQKIMQHRIGKIMKSNWW